MGANPLHLDPTHLTGAYRRWVSELRRRWSELRFAMKVLVETEDAFGLRKNPPLVVMAEPQRWRFLTDTAKHTEFQRWFEQQSTSSLLATEGMDQALWTSRYILEAYKKGVTRAYTAARPDVGAATPDFLGGARAQFLDTAFNSPAAIDKVRLLFERDYTQLKGVTAHMSQEIGRVLADGLVGGVAPELLYRHLAKTLDGHLVRAVTVARTELTHAHAEGQLDAFEAVDPDMELSVLAEWVTASKPCNLCAPMSGMILTITQARGLIPRHPRCQCAWVPANVAGRRVSPTTRARLERAILRSVRAERPRATDPLAESKWVGADRRKR